MTRKTTTTKLQTPRASKSAFVLDTDRLSTFGQEMATAATQQVKSSVTYWDQCRTLFIEGQANGKAQEAHEALFKAGDNVKGKKAPWYRTYKSILASAIALNIAVTDSMGMSALQGAIKDAKAQAIENDPAKAEEKRQNLIAMFRRMVSGCLNAGVKRAQLATILKDVEV